MCGIAGIINIDGNMVKKDMVESMTRILRHRGPDDMGLYLDRNVGLGHRRLSIVDLSPAGHQPMSNQDGTIWVVYNGEIYNFRSLREELRAKGYKFRSNTDTEVIVHAYEEWGPDCLNRFDGMWAFAIWDDRQRKLFCARDRFGIKPFYYFQNNRTFAFASEIKALLELDILPREPNQELIYDYLVHGLVDHTNMGEVRQGILECIRQSRSEEARETLEPWADSKIQAYNFEDLTGRIAVRKSLARHLGEIGVGIAVCSRSIHFPGRNPRSSAPPDYDTSRGSTRQHRLGLCGGPDRHGCREPSALDPTDRLYVAPTVRGSPCGQPAG